MPMRLTPRGDRVLVCVIEEKETTPNAAKPRLKLILPPTDPASSTYAMPRSGRVVAVGDGPAAQKAGYRVGDVLFFSKWCGQPMKISPRTYDKLAEHFDDKRLYLFLNTKDIYGRTPRHEEKKTVALAPKEKCPA